MWLYQPKPIKHKKSIVVAVVVVVVVVVVVIVSRGYTLQSGDVNPSCTSLFHPFHHTAAF